MTLKYIILLFLIYFFPIAIADDLTEREKQATQRFYEYIVSEVNATAFTIEQLKQFIPQNWWGTLDDYMVPKYPSKAKKVGIATVHGLMKELKGLKVDFMTEIIRRSLVKAESSQNQNQTKSETVEAKKKRSKQE